MAVATAVRKKAAAKGQTAYGDSYPVPNVSYLHKALQAVGRVAPGKRGVLGAFLRKRARELGAWNVVKGSWADNTQGKLAMANALRIALDLAGSGGPMGAIPTPVSNVDYQFQSAKLTGVGAKVYRRLRSKGMPHKQALPLAKAAHQRALRNKAQAGSGNGSPPGGSRSGSSGAPSGMRMATGTSGFGRGTGTPNPAAQRDGEVPRGGHTGYGKTTGRAPIRPSAVRTTGPAAIDRAYIPRQHVAGPPLNPGSGLGNLPKTGSTGLGKTTGHSPARLPRGRNVGNGRSPRSSRG